MSGPEFYAAAWAVEPAYVFAAGMLAGHLLHAAAWWVFRETFGWRR
ncbi:MAG: hypothetical protein AAGG47_21345 [Pseudomonadota bacterium]